MKKIYTAILLLSICSPIFAMDGAYQLPHPEVIKDRMRYGIGTTFGMYLGNIFIAKTNLHMMGNEYHQPLSVASRAQGAVHNFCSEHMDKEKALNMRKPLEHIVIYELFKDHPRAIDALQSNYNILPHPYYTQNK